MIDSKFQSLYLDYQVSKYQKHDRRLNIFLALVSSSSIGAWAIWNEYQIIWALIIAIANIVNVVKPYFPFSKYIKELNEVALSMQNLHLDYERLWYKFDNDQVKELDATEMFFDLKTKGITNLRLKDDTLVFEDNKVYKEAESK